MTVLWDCHCCNGILVVYVPGRRRFLLLRVPWLSSLFREGDDTGCYVSPNYRLCFRTETILAATRLLIIVFISGRRRYRMLRVSWLSSLFQDGDDTGYYVSPDCRLCFRTETILAATCLLIIVFAFCAFISYRCERIIINIKKVKLLGVYMHTMRTYIKSIGGFRGIQRPRRDPLGQSIVDGPPRVQDQPGHPWNSLIDPLDTNFFTP